MLMLMVVTVCTVVDRTCPYSGGPLLSSLPHSWPCDGSDCMSIVVDGILNIVILKFA